MVITRSAYGTLNDNETQRNGEVGLFTKPPKEVL